MGRGRWCQERLQAQWETVLAPSRHALNTDLKWGGLPTPTSQPGRPGRSRNLGNQEGEVGIGVWTPTMHLVRPKPPCGPGLAYSGLTGACCRLKATAHAGLLLSLEMAAKGANTGFLANVP
jgi:hypothetical protein